jgi:outer membrane protein
LRQRLQSDDDRLRGLGDVRRTARAEFQAGYAADCFTAKGDVASDIAHRGQGTIVDLSLTAHRVVLGRLQVESGVAASGPRPALRIRFSCHYRGTGTASGLPNIPPAGFGRSRMRR